MISCDAYDRKPLHIQEKQVGLNLLLKTFIKQAFNQKYCKNVVSIPNVISSWTLKS